MGANRHVPGDFLPISARNPPTQPISAHRTFGAHLVDERLLDRRRANNQLESNTTNKPIISDLQREHRSAKSARRVYAVVGRIFPERSIGV